MANKKYENPISVYAAVSHISFVVITPLLLFIWGGSWLTDRLGLPDWCMIIFILTGIFVMLCSLVSYLMKIIQKYGGSDKSDRVKTDKYHNLKNDRKDYDYYYENRVKK